MRESIFSNVLFPAPLRPMIPIVSPCLTSNDTSLSAQIVSDAAACAADSIELRRCLDPPARHERLLVDVELHPRRPQVVGHADRELDRHGRPPHSEPLAGAPAQWAYPAADTIVGMKWVARRFARRVLCRTR